MGVAGVQGSRLPTRRTELDRRIGEPGAAASSEVHRVDRLHSLFAICQISGVPIGGVFDPLAIDQHD